MSNTDVEHEIAEINYVQIFCCSIVFPFHKFYTYIFVASCYMSHLVICRILLFVASCYLSHLVHNVPHRTKHVQCPFANPDAR